MATIVPPLNSATLAALANDARSAAEKAYAPYSRFHVGAALLCADGRIFTAANVENVSYGLSLCAEANVIAAAAVAGNRQTAAIAVTGYRAADPQTPVLAMPCGRCRQILAEFATAETLIHVVPFPADRGTAKTMTMAELLPFSFGAEALG
ncbi:MAG: cytidine deaminase [Pseudomonadota bacterium]